MEALKAGRITKPVVAWVRCGGGSRGCCPRSLSLHWGCVRVQQLVVGSQIGLSCRCDCGASCLEGRHCTAIPVPCCQTFFNERLAASPLPCSGTCAKLFKSEVQFGHAGAKSGGDDESAQVRGEEGGGAASTWLRGSVCGLSGWGVAAATGLRASAPVAHTIHHLIPSTHLPHAPLPPRRPRTRHWRRRGRWCPTALRRWRGRSGEAAALLATRLSRPAASPCRAKCYAMPHPAVI